jgi:hypothetical protein
MPNRVLPLKDNSSGDFYEEGFNHQQDALDTAGLYIQNTTSNDANVLVSRDSSNNLTLTDPNAGSTTLAKVVNTPSNYDFLLDNEPTSVGTTYALSLSGGLVSTETWTNTATSKTIKTIAYTYSTGLIQTEVHKVFAADGTTVVAQKTVTYTYSGGSITGSTVTRDV